jgi:molybdenum cofactor biosynthesis protein B
MSELKPGHHGHHHRRQAPREVSTALITVSDTRTLETDTGGASVLEFLEAAGHPIALREIVADEAEAIRGALVRAAEVPDVRAVIFTGGTGIAPRDVTPDCVEPMLERIVPGFGEIFRLLSYQDIGSAAILSRALAGLYRGKIVFVIPGSRGAVRLAMEKLILPEIGHLAGEAVKQS